MLPIKVNKCRTEVEEAFYACGNQRETTCSLADTPSSLSSRFLSWGFELDAMGVVKVNLRLIPSVTFKVSPSPQYVSVVL